MTLLIAEFGSSPAPTWDFDLWCLMAKRSGADAVKVQLFRAEHFPEAEQASKRPLEFPRARWEQYLDAAHGRRLQAGASVFDFSAVTLAGSGDFLKIAAREQGDEDLRLDVMQIGKKYYRSISRRDDGFQWPCEVTLWTIPRYPTPMLFSVYQLIRAVWWFKRHGMRWGWSSHTRGISDCVIAARLGAEVIEKHFSIAPNNIEAGHSLLSEQFKKMSRRIKGNS